MSAVLVACAAYQAGRAVSEFGEGDHVQGWLSVLLVADGVEAGVTRVDGLLWVWPMHIGACAVNGLAIQWAATGRACNSAPVAPLVWQAAARTYRTGAARTPASEQTTEVRL